MPDPQTSLLGAAILQRLQRMPMSGYELKKRFASSLGFGWRAYDTQIYRELKALETAGLVAGRTDKGGRGPERRIFSMTEQGHVALLDWLESPLEDTWYKSELTLRIWSMDLIPPAALDDLLDGVEGATRSYLEQLDDRRAELRQRYGAPESASDGQGVGNQLILEFDAQVAQLKLAWIDRVRAVARLRTLLSEARRDSAGARARGRGRAPRTDLPGIPNKSDTHASASSRV
ncbi:MAG: helix-turn-helix transcriptional regulator [Chloroflexi bacterium]|nr:helix-turn-helix transcriptional regulator [Chloroflexota bacterium]